MEILAREIIVSTREASVYSVYYKVKFVLMHNMKAWGGSGCTE
jgi:hypothetical protein